MAYLKREELERMHFRSLGEDVCISDKAVIYHPERISLGNHVRIDDFVLISAGEKGVSIGDYVHIAPFCGLYGSEAISIGNYCALSSRVSVYSATDDYGGDWLTNPTFPEHLRNVQTGPILLGTHVIVGVGATLLPGARLDDGCAVGAHSLVTKHFERLSIVVGAPARFLKRRSDRIFALERELREGEK